MNPDDESAIKTTETSLRIVETIAELGGSTTDELAEILSLAPSTIHRHVSTLRDRNYVTKEGNRFHVGLAFLTLGGHARRRVEAYPAVMETVDRLAEETGQRAQFAVLDGDERVCLYTDVGESAVRTGAGLGRRGPLHASAAGKAILAELPDSRVTGLVDARGLAPAGPNAITDRESLAEELDRVRERGVAFDRQESVDGVRGVAAVVRNGDGAPVGALEVSGGARRLKGAWYDEELPDRLLGAANELELDVRHA